VESFEDKVARFIQANHLFAGAARVLLAVSGGADSIALLHVMQALARRGVVSADLLCAHVNHQLRGAASDGDEMFVKARAAELGLPVITKSVDVRALAQTQKLSVETAGRQLRLACLGEVARTEGCAWIATGHQKEDNAETILHRLRRGTGFRGLAGIWPARTLDETSTLARPLLDCHRAEIAAYLRTRNLRWRDDATNTDCAHTRNYIRHRLLPALQRRSAESLVTTLGNLAAAAHQLHERVAAQARQAAADHVCSENGDCFIDTATLTSLPEMVAVEMIRCQLATLGCGERDLTRRHYQGILGLVRSGVAGRGLALPNGFLVHQEYGRVVLRRDTAAVGTEATASDIPIRLPGTTHFGSYRIEATALAEEERLQVEITSNRNPLREYFDFDRLTPPLIVRRRRVGDRFQPLGLTGSKKVGKFLTAAKIPEKLRQQALVFEDGRGIVWLCPVRISERAKVTKHTRRILLLRVSGPHFPRTPHPGELPEAS